MYYLSNTDQTIYVPSEGTMSLSVSDSPDENSVTVSEGITKLVSKIGSINLPWTVLLSMEKEEDVFCVSCKELGIVACASSYESAEEKLEEKLKDALFLYLYIYKDKPLDPVAEKYRKLLSLIAELNGI